MNIKEFKEEIELKIKITEDVLKVYCKKGDIQYKWHSGYLKACKEILEDIKEVKEGISVSPDLIMSVEELHKSSLKFDAFKESWNEINKEEKTKKDG